MYRVNDKVIHAREGLSTITSIAQMAGNEYFVVKICKIKTYLLLLQTINIYYLPSVRWKRMQQQD